VNLDRGTYEAWLLDRIEGRLTPAQEHELDAFLAANPDLHADTDALPGVEAEPSDFEGKHGLKRSFPPTGLPDSARLADFLVARLERTLTPEQELALDRFLYEHPEHAQDAKRMVAARADAGPVSFEDKASLERHFPPQGLPDRHRLTDFLIAAQEGDLSAEQRHALAEYLRTHPDARKEQRLISAVKVAAEPVVFAGKASLKKREGRVIALWQRYAVAASIALLLGFAWWMMRANNGTGPAIAGTEKPPEEANVPGSTAATATGAEALPGDAVPPGPIAVAAEAETVREPRPAGTRGGDPSREENAPAIPVQEQETPSAPPTEPLTPEPQLAETPPTDPVPDHAPEEPAPVDEPVLASLPHTTDERPTAGSADGTPVGTVVANAVRGNVLDTRERPAALDRDDALALANRALGAVTGGEGRVDVATKGARRAWKLRLGPNVAISASTGR